MEPAKALLCVALTLLVACSLGGIDVQAANFIKVPILLAVQEPDETEVDTVEMSWDHGSSPDPIQMRWATSQIPVHGTALEPLKRAFDYAQTYQSAARRPTGILSLSITVSGPVGEEGPSVGAGLAVGFLAVLRGDQLASGIAMTGTLESTGRIGPVQNIEQKIRIAVHQGYRVVLVPRGQIRVPRARLVGMGVRPNVVIREVGTIEEAYTIMTGKSL